MLLFFDAPNPESSLYKRKVAAIEVNGENCYIEIGICPVLFGYRVRSGIYNKNEEYCLYYDVDLCCGDNPYMVTLVYNTLVCKMIENVYILRQGARIHNIIPTFSVNPIAQDSNFKNFLKVNPTTYSKLEPTYISNEDLQRMKNDINYDIISNWSSSR